MLNHQQLSKFVKLVKRYLLPLLFCLGLLGGALSGQSPLLASRWQLTAVAQAVSADQQMQQGADHYQAGDFLGSIAAWQLALALYHAENETEKIALVAENLARAYQALGQSNQELQAWQQAESAYRQTGNALRVGRMLSEQAQAYSRLGQYGKAIKLLCGEPGQPTCELTSALAIMQSLPQPDLVGKLTALGSLGDAYRLRGQPEQAIAYLNQALQLTENQEPAYRMTVHSSLGNAYLSLAQISYRRAASARQIEEIQEAEAFESEAADYDTKALVHLKQSLEAAQQQADPMSELRAKISILQIYLRSGQIVEFNNALQQAIELLETTPDNSEKIYAAIDLAKLAQQPSGGLLTSNRTCGGLVANAQVTQLLEQAVDITKQINQVQAINYWRAKSFALGELGHLYECQSDYERALDFTYQAQEAADLAELSEEQRLDARDSLYLWQWQAGRILKATGQIEKAIQAYEDSLATLETIRQDILVTSRDVQLDFRENVEPIYRELVALKLQNETPSVPQIIETAENSQSDNLASALKTLDSLKLAELQNFFGNDCVLTALNLAGQNIAENASKTKAAIFSTAVLDNRTAVIVDIYTQTSHKPTALRQFEWIKDGDGQYISQETLTLKVNEYRQGLERFRDAIAGAPLGGYNPALAEKLYGWLIRPFQPLLDQQGIQTLVFVQDGIFRNVPMTALYDGTKFLIEQYAIAITPSINLTDFSQTNRRDLRALAVGLSRATKVKDKPFGELAAVDSELKAIQEALPRSTQLTNENFTLARFAEELQAESYPIIHIATHGQFSAEAESAFLVTGDNLNDSDPKLTLNVLDDLIRDSSRRSSVELLVLSACQTATGDDRAALGLAGIAAQAGAKRVLASLWSANDQATSQLIGEFYQKLNDPHLTKAQILQAAQRSLINSGNRTAHPAYWSAFVLIGNWL